MTMQMIEVPVASALFPTMSPVTVKVTNAKSFHEAVRLAVYHAAKVEHIASPVVAVTEHELAVRMRRQLVAQHAPKMRIERNLAFWRQPEPRGAMYES